MEFYRWSAKPLEEIDLRGQNPGWCAEVTHERCERTGEVCLAIMARPQHAFDGDTQEEQIASREKAAKEARAKCRRLRIVISEDGG